MYLFQNKTNLQSGRTIFNHPDPWDCLQLQSRFTNYGPRNGFSYRLRAICRLQRLNREKPHDGVGSPGFICHLHSTFPVHWDATAAVAVGAPAILSSGYSQSVPSHEVTLFTTTACTRSQVLRSFLRSISRVYIPLYVRCTQCCIDS